MPQQPHNTTSSELLSLEEDFADQVYQIRNSPKIGSALLGQILADNEELDSI